jgi:hypothetical protein
MDHSPGQRQFANIEKYREYYQGKYLSPTRRWPVMKKSSWRWHGGRSPTVSDCRDVPRPQYRAGQP